MEGQGKAVTHRLRSIDPASIAACSPWNQVGAWTASTQPCAQPCARAAS